MVTELATVKEAFLKSLDDRNANLDRLFDQKVKTLSGLLEPFGPFLEAPSLRHTENIGRCSIYSEAETAQDSRF